MRKRIVNICLFAILSVLMIGALAPGAAFAGSPDPYKSGFEVIKGSAQASDRISADSEGLEYLIVLVSSDGGPLSGSVYVASSRTLRTDQFYFEGTNGEWVPVGANGEIPLRLVAANSASSANSANSVGGQAPDVGHVLSFRLKVVSTTPGKPVFAMGLHSDCVAAYVMSMEAPLGCDLSHIIGQTTFGGVPVSGIGGSGVDGSGVDGSGVDGSGTGGSGIGADAKESISFQRIGDDKRLVADGKTAYNLSVRITDDGKPVIGADIRFTVTDDKGAPTRGAVLSADTAVTDSDGVASVSVTVMEPGIYEFEASLSDKTGDAKNIKFSFLPVRPVLKFTVGSPFYTVGGVLADTAAPSFIQDGRTYLSVRDMGNALGVSVNWDQEAQAAILAGHNMVLRIPVGSSTLYMNNGGVSTTVTVDAPAINKDGRVYLPFRAVFTAFGYDVSYDEAKREITCR